jgi:hypothetical protein
MKTEQKMKLISQIMEVMKRQAFLAGKPFYEGIYLYLIFKTDDKLLRIKGLCEL